MSRSNPGKRDIPIEISKQKPRSLNSDNQISTRNSAEFFAVIEMEKRGEIKIWKMECGKVNGAYVFSISRINPNSDLRQDATAPPLNERNMKMETDSKLPSGASLPPRTCSAFLREYLGMPWTPSPEEKRLRELAREYHERTESYDRTVCTGPIVRGGIMPAKPEQHSLINSHARTVRDELGVEAARLGFTLKQWREAISNAAHDMPNDQAETSAACDVQQPKTL